jgi:hypothetical protein
MKRKLLTRILALTIFALPVLSQTGIPAGSMSQCDAQMQAFMSTYQDSRRDTRHFQERQAGLHACVWNC